MESHPVTPSSRRQHATMLVAAVSLVTLVLSSLDQSTRGPSITGMVLSNLGHLV